MRKSKKNSAASASAAPRDALFDAPLPSASDVLSGFAAGPSPDDTIASGIDAQSFINVIFKVITYSTDIDERLNEVLELTANKFNLAEASVGVLDDAEECLRVRYIWKDAADGDKASASVMPYAGFPDLAEALRCGRIFVYSGEQDICSESETEYFCRAGFATNITYPIFIYENVFGFLSLSRRDRHRWTESDKSVFATISYIVESILLRLEMEKEIRGANSLMDFVLQNSPAAIAVFDPATSDLIYANSNFHEMHGIGEYVVGDLSAAQEPEQGATHEVFLPEQEKWLNLQYNSAKWTDGRNVVICSASDITTVKRQAARIEQLAFYDGLLGIPNRAKFDIDLPRYIKSERGAVIFVDLDNFKSINDSYSHAHGDNLLKEIARFCHDLPKHGDVYRYGGDEFVIIADLAGVEEVESICAAIIERCKKPWNIGQGKQCYCTASLGAALYPEDADLPEDIVKCADIAVFKSKAEGKNTLTLYTVEMNANFLDQAALEMHMRKALNEDMDGFEVYYQPIMGKDGHCAGAEALLRWHVPGLGQLKQAEFVPLAEYLGLIDHIGNWLLEIACQQCKLWNNAFDPDFFVTVFLSNKQMRANGFTASLREKIERFGLRPRNLILEVTEADKERDASFAKKLISELNNMGVTVAISGFGTGFVSFLKLRNLGIDIVKIGPDMVQDITGDRFVESFLRSMVDMLHSLGRSVCVKGVENAEQVAVLREGGVDLLQGYHFGRAAPAESFEADFLEG